MIHLALEASFQTTDVAIRHGGMLAKIKCYVKRDSTSNPDLRQLYQLWRHVGLESGGMH
jgi:hypothetical protein